MSAIDDWTPRQRGVAAAVLGLILLAAGIWYFYPRTPAQMGTDEEVFATVDALFTAVTAHDEKLLLQNEQRIQALKDAGKLPEHAAGYLDGVIADARGGDWQPAAEDLYWFMKGQRREGAHGHSVAKKRN